MKHLRGVPASPGVAVGAARLIQPSPAVDLNAPRTASVEAEVARLDHALASARARLEVTLAAAPQTVAELLVAQREMLDDPELRRGAEELIAQGLAAESAVSRVAATFADQLAALPDPYLAGRSDDVREAGRRVVAALRGERLELRLERAAILIAETLSPAEIVQLDATLLQGIVTETGTATGHLAIVALGLGIPAVVGVAAALATIRDGTTVVVDGEAGSVAVDPDAASLAAAEVQAGASRHSSAELAGWRDRPGATADGVRVAVYANIGSADEAQTAVEMGAEGVGLFRTELLAASGLPSEETQVAVYQQVASLLQRPLVVRTFDIGGDKPVPGLELPAEPNPFLGWRGIRLALDRPEEVLLPQVRALLRVAAGHDVRMLLPMVAVPGEVDQVREVIERAASDLRNAGVPTGRLPLGIMVETPAAALTLDRFVGKIDFASLGTNDLVQYLYAVDRTNLRVAGRAEPLGLALLRLVERACACGLPIAVCGQLAADPRAIPILVGLGVRELSVPPSQVPAVKRALYELSLAEMIARVRNALEGD